MTTTTKEKLEVILGGLPSSTLDEIYSELYDVLCKLMMGLLQDSLEGPVQKARTFTIVPVSRSAIVPVSGNTMGWVNRNTIFQ